MVQSGPLTRCALFSHPLGMGAAADGGCELVQSHVCRTQDEILSTQEKLEGGDDGARVALSGRDSEQSTPAGQTHTIASAMPITVRAFRENEASTFLDIQGRSVRSLAAQHYTSEVIEAWVVTPTAENVRGFLLNPDHEIRLIAELAGKPVGIGALVVRNSELRACYVVPEAARKGVGSALVREIERLAKAHGLTRLHLQASVNAEPFYAALGYDVVERGEHVLRTGQRMAAVRMVKPLP